MISVFTIAPPSVGPAQIIEAKAMFREGSDILFSIHSIAENKSLMPLPEPLRKTWSTMGMI
jgi:hypothetical protein